MVIIAFVILIAALLYSALNRKHEVQPQTPPIHEER